MVQKTLDMVFPCSYNNVFVFCHSLQTFLLEGEPPVLDFLGIAFGHVYHHLNTAGILRAPNFVVDWYKESDSQFASMIREKYKAIASDFEVI